MDESVTQTSLTCQRYKELSSQLGILLPEFEIQCSTFLSSLTPDADTLLAPPTERLEALEKFSGSFDKQKQDVAELHDCGKCLVAILDLLDCSDTPKACEIRRNIDTTAQQMENIVTLLETRRSELTAEVELYAKAELEIENIVNWLEAVDAQMQSSSHLCLSEKDLTQQLGTEKCQKDTAVKWQEHSDEVTARCKQLRMAPVKYAGLLERCSTIVLSTDKHIKQFEDLQQKLVALQESADNMKCWMSDAASLLSGKSASVDTFTDRQMFVENLSNQWHLKRREYEELLESAKMLEIAEFSLDHSSVDELLLHIEHDWCQLSRLFVNYISAQVYNCDYLGKFRL